MTKASLSEASPCIDVALAPRTQGKTNYLAEVTPTFAAGLKVIGASMSPSVVLSNAERPA
jgi:hypothetical protein